MKRKITADEVRDFFLACDRQFCEAGFYLHSVKFIRTAYDQPPTIQLNFDEKETNNTDTDNNQSDK